MSKLLTEELKKTLPKLRAQDGSKDPIVYMKFFFPASNWTWYVTEGEVTDDDDFLFFGYVIGFEREWGYFGMSELEGVNVHGIRVARDLSFDPKPLSYCGLWSSQQQEN